MSYHVKKQESSFCGKMCISFNLLVASLNHSNGASESPYALLSIFMKQGSVTPRMGPQSAGSRTTMLLLNPEPDSDKKAAVRSPTTKSQRLLPAMVRKICRAVRPAVGLVVLILVRSGSSKPRSTKRALTRGRPVHLPRQHPTCCDCSALVTLCHTPRPRSEGTV